MTVLPFLRLQPFQEVLVDRRPLFAPAADRLGVLKSARALLQQGQVVERIKDVLFLPIAAGMAGDGTSFRCRMSTRKG